MCEYCEDENPLINVPWDKVTIEAGSMVLGTSNNYEKLPINFCPMCGDDLSAWHENDSIYAK